MNRTSLVAHLVKNLPAVQENQVQSLGWEDPLEKEMITHSSILTWRITWQRNLMGSMGSQRHLRFSVHTGYHWEIHCRSQEAHLVLVFCYFVADRHWEPCSRVQLLREYHADTMLEVLTVPLGDLQRMKASSHSFGRHSLHSIFILKKTHFSV